MSAGNFNNYNYIDDNGVTHFVRLQPETLSLDIGGVVNNEPTATPDEFTYTLNTKESRKKNGIHAREINIRLTADGGAGKLVEYAAGTTHAITWLDPTTFPSVVKNQTGTYQGIPCVVVSPVKESRV